MYTKRDILNLLIKSRSIISRIRNGEKVDSIEITLAYDCIDMIADEIVLDNVDLSK